MATLMYTAQWFVFASFAILFRLVMTMASRSSRSAISDSMSVMRLVR
jgi:hypothetical protein